MGIFLQHSKEYEIRCYVVVCSVEYSGPFSRIITLIGWAADDTENDFGNWNIANDFEGKTLQLKEHHLPDNLKLFYSQVLYLSRASQSGANKLIGLNLFPTCRSLATTDATWKESHSLSVYNMCNLLVSLPSRFKVGGNWLTEIVWHRTLLTIYRSKSGEKRTHRPPTPNHNMLTSWRGSQLLLHIIRWCWWWQLVTFLNPHYHCYLSLAYLDTSVYSLWARISTEPQNTFLLMRIRITTERDEH